MKKFTKIIALISALMLVLTSFAGCRLMVDQEKIDERQQAEAEIQRLKEQAKETVFTINGDIEVSSAYYGWYFSNLYNEEYSMQYQAIQSAIQADSSADSSATPVIDVEAIKEQAKTEIATVKLAYLKAMENGLTLSDNDKAAIEDEINTFKSNVSQTGMTFEDYLLFVLNTNEETLNQIVTEEYIGNLYYASLAKDYYATSKHILVQFGEGNRTKEDAKKLADEIKAKINAGEDFDELMEKYSEDGRDADGKISMPNGYTFTTGEMVPEFEEESFRLKEGEVSEPVLVEGSGYSGYHIIKKMPLNISDVALSMFSSGESSIMSIMLGAEKDNLIENVTFEETEKIKFFENSANNQ